jgi:integrase
MGEVKSHTHRPDSTSPIVRAAGEAWIKRGQADGLERSTLDQRRQHLDLHIVPLLGEGTKLSKIDVEAFRDVLLTTRSRAMAKKVMTSLKAILRQAKMAHLATDTAGIKAGGRHRKRLEVGVDIPQVPEVKALLDAADTKSRALVCLAAFGGLRASEIRGLAWSRLNLDKAQVEVAERADKWGLLGSPKSEAAKRTITLNATTVQALRAWKLAQPPLAVEGPDGSKIKRPRALVFGTATDKPDLLGNLQRRVLAPLQVKAGATSRYSFHGLRHFAISSWLKTCNGDFKAVQIRAGHATLALTLDTYGHLLDVNDAAQIAAAENLVLG